MFLLPVSAAIAASAGWAAGIVLAQAPARQLGAFEFTRIQLIACAAILFLAATLLGGWTTVAWQYWSSFVVSILFGIVIGNLAMIECLRRGGPRRTEVLLSLKAPIVAGLAYLWLGEALSALGVFGVGLAISGVLMAVLSQTDKPELKEKVSGSIGIVIMLGLIATTSQGIGFLIMKPAMLAGTDPIAASAIRLTGAAFLVSVIGLWPAQVFRCETSMTPTLLGRTILPGFIGYGVSSTLLLYAFANFEAGAAAVLGSLSPVLILPILWVRDGVRPSFQAILGAAFAVLGTSLIVLT
ncbi:DMT family transporter [Parasedimentitalea huanghaiensis]|uniref:EamA family transporter n=1 Tax=Parasedimentitalea huanghaiensis TaxID=2682100 RepID=A0A6L6WEA9_9RHOB|nr:DMT family transporter [Zongyanglinia huanghaiensis]MVO15780.1 EamA family transporter [Zongyanglinia huanghaiensis]